MRKVIYPGPAVEGEARLTPQHFGALQVHLAVGENEVADDVAEQLVKLRIVEAVAGEAPTEGDATVPEDGQGDVNITGRRSRRQS